MQKEALCTKHVWCNKAARSDPTTTREVAAWIMPSELGILELHTTTSLGLGSVCWGTSGHRKVLTHLH